jgi:Na+/melibiose symporter-like transporter
MTRARRDLIAIATIAVIVAALLIALNGAERLEGWINDNERWQLDEILITLTVVGVAFAAFAIRRWRELAEEQKTTRVLRGILPICASCKRMRDEAGDWRQFEEVIRDKSEAEFSHGLCPACAARYEALIPKVPV